MSDPSPAVTSFAAAVTSLGQVALTVTDLARAVAFYRDTLGLTHLFDAGKMTFFNCGGVRIMLSLAEEPNSGHNSILYYRVEDMQEACARLTAKGVAFEAPARLVAKMPDHELWMAFLKDSEGNLLALMSEVRGK